MIRPCEECGSAFDARRVTARFCSDSCRVTAHRARVRRGEVAPRWTAVHPLSACSGCGKRMQVRSATPPKCNECRRAERPPRACQACGAAMARGAKGTGLCAACVPPRRTAPCEVCGELMKLGATSGEGTHRHHACAPKRSATCECGASKHPYSERCRDCANRAQRTRPDDDRRTSRRDRERAAPGLGWSARQALLKRWRRQHRVCSYCRLAPATTIDHVIPLVRGGTNFEGNLVPSCRACNSRKHSKLVIEMRAA